MSIPCRIGVRTSTSKMDDLGVPLFLETPIYPHALNFNSATASLESSKQSLTWMPQLGQSIVGCLVFSNPGDLDDCRVMWGPLAQNDGIMEPWIIKTYQNCIILSHVQVRIISRHWIDKD